MSSREPLWFCHECNAEMQPLMMPDPHCASCRGTFVEKMENTQDDPRTYQQQPMPGGMEEGYPPGMDHFLLGLHAVLNHGTGRDRAASPRAASPTRAPSSPGPTLVELNGGPSGTTRILTFGGPNTLGRNDSTMGGAAPTLAQFLGDGMMAPAEPSPRPERTDRGAVTGPLMAQYLMALLGAQRGAETATRGDAAGDPLLNIFGRLGLGGGLGGLGGLGLGGEGQANGGGRWGDYVFNQEALDEIITQLMENSNSNRPVPATGDIIEGLPRVTLSKESPLLQRDCAVCKDQFALDGEDPAEQIVVTLPCTHPFHEACIVPWIKSSGTCPVCRYALVPQPDQHAHDAPAGGAARGGAARGAGILPPLAPVPVPLAFAPPPPAPPVIPQTPPEALRSSDPPEPPTVPRSPTNPQPPPRSGGRGSQSGSSGGGFFNSLFSGFVGGNRRSSTDSTRSQSRRRRSDGAPNLPGGWNGNDS